MKLKSETIDKNTKLKKTKIKLYHNSFNYKMITGISFQCLRY